jgi:internalin A
LQLEVVKLRTVSEQFPNNWLAVKKAIEENTSGAQHYLTYESYKEICKQNHVANDKAQSLLLRYFNTIGTVTWFGEDTHLKFLHVLNPAWIKQGVYKILTAKKTANLFGQIDVSDFKELLQPVNKTDYTYEETHYGFILSMMKKFDLCYTPDDKQLLIPSAFGKVPKLEYSDFRGVDVRTYILQFKDYMPLALIHRFTAQKMPEALDNNYWYTGIVIRDTKTQTLAMVHADKEAKRIYVRIKGESKLGVWEHVRRDLAAIASSYAKIPYDELVTLDERDNGTVNYEDLVSHLRAQKEIYFHPKLQKDFNVGYLISLFEPIENTTDKILNGQIVLSDRANNFEINKVPPIVVNILNNNNPVVNTQINTQVNIDIRVVNEIGSTVKGEADYLLELIGDSNKILSEALIKVMQFADDAKIARNTGDIKEKGWGRKLKSVLETLGSAGEQLKNVQDGGEVLKSILGGIKELAHHFNLDAISSWFS